MLKNDKMLNKCKMTPPKPVEGKGREITAWNQWGGLIARCAKKLKVDPAVALAVIVAESGGVGMKEHGHGVSLPIIRFEPHVFWRRWGKQDQQTQSAFHHHFTGKSFKDNHTARIGENGNRESFHGSQRKEWKALQLAMSFAKNEAIESTSWGLSQVMGFNHKLIGYDDAESMMQAFMESERFHILAFFDFCSQVDDCMKGMVNKNFHQFARGYNGSGNMQHYGKIIRYLYKNAQRTVFTPSK